MENFSRSNKNEELDSPEIEMTTLKIRIGNNNEVVRKIAIPAGATKEEMENIIQQSESVKKLAGGKRIMDVKKFAGNNVIVFLDPGKNKY